MKSRTLIIGAVTLAFGAYTVWALAKVGYVGLLLNTTETLGVVPIGSLQIAVDLVIMAVIAMGWMIIDAKQQGINPWPYVAITLPLGSLGPLAYLLHRSLKA